MKVYLDNNATAPIRPEVIDVVKDVMAQVGNASSIHGYGRGARKDVEKARESVARLAGCEPDQVIFTSGATESNNSVLNQYHGSTVLVSAIEHPAGRAPASDSIKIPVTPDGVIDLERLNDFLKRHAPVALVSVMMVNNETGVIQPMEDIIKLAHDAGAKVHSDAVQAAGRLPIRFNDFGFDSMALSAHKFGGPQGVGALILKKGMTIEPYLKGGGQERRMRAGTENVAGIAGFGKAAELALEHMDDFQNLDRLLAKMEDGIKSLSPQAVIYGAESPRVSNTCCLGLPGVPAETLLMNLDLGGIAVSTGSACSSGVVKPSPVIKAMGASEQDAANTVRLSMGWHTTQEDIDHFLKIWSKVMDRLQDKINKQQKH